jgi:hypothetical protein
MPCPDFFFVFFHFVGLLGLSYNFYSIALSNGEDDDVELVESIGGIDGDHQNQMFKTYAHVEGVHMLYWC